MTVVLSTPVTVVARWSFASAGGAAIDEALSQAPARFRGSLALRVTKHLASDGSVTFSDTAEAVERFYVLGGITPLALARMTGEDALNRVPVQVLLARSREDVPQQVSPSDGRASRGLAATTTVRRALSVLSVPSEPPAL